MQPLGTGIRFFCQPRWECSGTHRAEGPTGPMDDLLPAGVAPNDRIGPAVEEFVRYATPVMQFARFVHAEEHQWVQSNLLDGMAEPNGAEAAGISTRGMATLFEMDDVKNQ